MSFSSDVKEEIAKHSATARHCQIAELTALVMMCGCVKTGPAKTMSLCMQTENRHVARHSYSLLRKLSGQTPELRCMMNKNALRTKGTTGILYEIWMTKQEQCENLLSMMKLDSGDLHTINPLIYQQTCCKKSFISGAFLAAGSINNPEKTYHFEIACVSPQSANTLVDILREFDIEAKTIIRKRYHVVYVKEGAAIVDILNIMEAHVSLMNMENVRILKDMRNSVNRRVNCEYANINKTVSAAHRQIEDILYIEQCGAYRNLPATLKEIAELRLQEPDAALQELGEMLSPPVSKSGVNHRLRKLSSIANDLRKEHEIQITKGD